MDECYDASRRMNLYTEEARAMSEQNVTQTTNTTTPSSGSVYVEYDEREPQPMTDVEFEGDLAALQEIRDGGFREAVSRELMHARIVELEAVLKQTEADRDYWRECARQAMPMALTDKNARYEVALKSIADPSWRTELRAQGKSAGDYAGAIARAALEAAHDRR